MRGIIAYYAVVVPGLGEVACQELLSKLPAAVVQRCDPGRVHFSYPGPPADLLKLRVAENVLAHLTDLDGFTGGVEDLGRLEEAFRGLDLRAALEALERVRTLPDDPAFRITAFREGSHHYRSLDAAAWAGAGLQRAYGWRVDLEHPDFDVWLQIEGDRATVGLRLFGQEMGRRSRVAHGPASLRPTVAHAMCLLTRPQAGEVFLDPMCGTGTILVERSLAQAGAVMVGADWHVGALNLAKRNLEAAGLPVRLVRADACAMPLRSGTVDALACNLPWGRRIGTHASNRRLYPRFLEEARRVLRSGATMVLLTAERRLMLGSLEACPGLRLVETTVLSLGGMHPSIYAVRRE